jgi:transcriptional regulator with XRE-family HTH domain
MATLTPPEIDRAKELRDARTAKGLSQRELEELTGVLQPIISSYETRDPRYPLSEDRFKVLMSAIERAPAKPPESTRARNTKPARVTLPTRLASRWEAMSLGERSAIVQAGMEYLGH